MGCKYWYLSHRTYTYHIFKLQCCSQGVYFFDLTFLLIPLSYTSLSYPPLLVPSLLSSPTPLHLSLFFFFSLSYSSFFIFYSSFFTSTILPPLLILLLLHLLPHSFLLLFILSSCSSLYTSTLFPFYIYPSPSTSDLPPPPSSISSSFLPLPFTSLHFSSHFSPSTSHLTPTPSHLLPLPPHLISLLLHVLLFLPSPPPSSPLSPLLAWTPSRKGRYGVFALGPYLRSNMRTTRSICCWISIRYRW